MRKSTKALFSDLYDLHQSGVALDTKLIVDDGELAIHWPLLQLWGHNWWSGLGQAGADNVVLLPGVSMNEAQEFVDVLYGRFQASNKHFTVTEDTGVTDEDMYNNNISDEGDIKLEPYEIFDQFPCDFCGKVFDNKSSLAVHVNNTHRLRPQTCEVCGKTFKNNKSLLDHLRLHKTIECECGKSIKAASYLQHKAKCQIYKCTDCDYETRSKRDLNTHLKVHQQNLFQCIFCNYTTSRNANLKRHILNVHSDSAKFCCDECDKQFSRESSLSYHKEAKHSSKIKCELCDKDFETRRNLEKHILDQHTHNKITTSNGFMILHQSERTIKRKVYFCQQCDYKTTYKGNLMKHVERMHLNPRPPKIDPSKTCLNCNFTFTKYSNFKVHSLRCKVKLKKKVDLEDYVDLMKTRGFNFRDIAAVSRLHRSHFGRNAVRPNLIKTLNKAVDDLKDYHSVEKVTLQRNQKEDKKVIVETFETYTSFVSNINGFTEMACEKLGVDPLDAKFLWSCDGGGGKTLLTMDIILPDGSHVTFVMLQADGCPENYFNITTLLKKLNLPSFNFSFKFVGDGKLIAIILGLSASNSVFMCPYCDGYRVGPDGKPTNKGEFIKGEERTLGWLHYNNSRIRIKQLRGETVKAKLHRNCIREPIKIREEVGLGDLECPILAGYPPENLHTLLLGSPNNLFKILEIKCPKALKPFKKKYHLEMTEGKMRGFSVFKIIIEYVSKEWEEITMVTVFG